jgi:hypothetical protein
MNDAEWNSVKMAAREEAAAVILQHLSLCPFSKLEIEERVRRIENRFTLLIGFMLGSGLLGGIAGSLLSKLIGS